MSELSIITGVQTSEFLVQTLRSIESQQSVEWEWLLVPAQNLTLPAEVTASTHVRVIEGAEQSGSLDVARALGVSHARSPFVLQLDDGDVLAPGALEAIRDALGRDDTDIVYGDFALFPIDGRPVAGYNPEYGWRTGTCEFEGQTLRTIESFEPLPSAVGHGSYAPRHGLAMSRTTYEEVGGHDPAHGAASTFALVCSAYAAGKSFTRIPEVLVFSRIHLVAPRDEQREREVASASMMGIVREWSQRSGLVMLDLGAAHNPAPGFISVDLQDADVNCDVRFGIPLPESSVGAIRASDFLEHMNTCPDSSCTHGADGVTPKCVVGIMNEFYRLLAPGGLLLTHTPSTDGRGAFQDPTHVSFWNPNSFWYYTRADQARFVRGITCRFQVARMWQGCPTEWHREHRLVYVDADLVALKGQIQPGICEI